MTTEFLAQSSFSAPWMVYNATIPACLKAGYLNPNTSTGYPDFQVFCQNRALFTPCTQAGGRYVEQYAMISAYNFGISSAEWAFRTSGCIPQDCPSVPKDVFLDWQIPLMISLFPSNFYVTSNGWGSSIYNTQPPSAMESGLSFAEKKAFLASLHH